MSNEYFNVEQLKNIEDARALLLDANVLIYFQQAYNELGTEHPIAYLEDLVPRLHWFVADNVTQKLYEKGTYPWFAIPLSRTLSSDYMDTRMDQFPFIKKNGESGFVKLNMLAADDWSQITMAHNYKQLRVVTNDWRMFKTAHAVLNGRAESFYNLIDNLDKLYSSDKDWNGLSAWLRSNVPNNVEKKNKSSWIIEGQDKRS